MAAPMSKADYLKKYLSENGEEKKKKKKRKPSNIPAKVPLSRIVDDDVDMKSLLPANLSNTLDEDVGDNDPTVADVIDERPEHVKQLEKYRSSGQWKVMGQSADADIKNQDADSGQLPLRGERHDSDSDQSPPRNQRHDSDSDQSPPRHKHQGSKSGDSKSMTKVNPPKDQSSRNKSLKNSEHSFSEKHSRLTPSKYQRHNSGSDGDQSPVRRHRHDSDSDQLSVKKQRHDSDSDQSPIRRQRHDSDSDQSPVRRQRHDSWSDQSPVRKQRHNSDSDQSPVRRQRHDSESDQSPVRRHRHDSDSDQSPPRYKNKAAHRKRKKSDSDESLPRQKRHDSDPDSDQSPPRRTSGKSKSVSVDRTSLKSGGSGKEHKTLGGKKAGLSSAKEMRQEAEELKQKEDAKFKSISDDRLGKDAATIFRDKSGKKRDIAEERRKEKEEAKKKEKDDEQFKQWGKGLKQIEHQADILQDHLHEMSKPLARYKDDEDLDQMMREMEREEDPMLAFIKKKKKKTDAPVPEKPRYKGPAPPPNRFGIMPGYRWDGVDRSNGFERQIYAKQAEKKAIEIQKYKWSTEDM